MATYSPTAFQGGRCLLSGTVLSPLYQTQMSQLYTKISSGVKEVIILSQGRTASQELSLPLVEEIVSPLLPHPARGFWLVELCNHRPISHTPVLPHLIHTHPCSHTQIEQFMEHWCYHWKYRVFPHHLLVVCHPWLEELWSTASKILLGY